MTAALRNGLEGVLVTESSHSSIDGDTGELVDRGYPIEALARHAPPTDRPFVHIEER